MSIFQNIALSASTVKMRWQEPYITSGLNEKSIAAFPKGVVAGFKVVPSSGYSVAIQVDSALGLSIANIFDTTGATKFAVTLVQSGALFVDLTLQAGTTVFIALDAQYSVGAASAAQVKVVDAAELLTNPDLVILAKITVPANPIPGPPILSTHIDTAYMTRSGDSVPLEARPLNNLLFNSSFEVDTNGGPAASWTAAGVASALCSTDFARTGTKSLKLTQGSLVLSTVTTAPVPVTPGESYVVGAWFRTDVTGFSGTGLRLRVLYLDKAFAFLNDEFIETPVTGVVTTFVSRRGQVVTPALAAHVQVQLYLDATTLGVGYADDIEFSTPRPETFAHSAVFGGFNSVADQYHQHTAAGQIYGGGVNWADGTPNPATNIEGQLDKILIDLSGASGAPKIGNAPSKILANVFVNTVANTASIDATGRGSGPGVIGRGEAGSGAHGVRGFGDGTGAGVRGDGGVNATGGTAFGVGGYFVGGTGAYGGDGIYVSASVAGRSGIFAFASGAGGTAVWADGGGTNGIGVQGFGTGSGSGGNFYTAIGAAAVNSTAALNGIGRGNNTKGVWGVGTGTEQGVYATGGVTAPTNFATRANGAGVLGIGGNAASQGVVGRGGLASTIGVGAVRLNVGVFGVGTGGGEGVVGVSAGTNGANGVVGEGSDSFHTHGVSGFGKLSGAGVRGFGQDGIDGWIGGHGGYFEGASGVNLPFGASPSGPAGVGVIGIGGDGWDDTDSNVMGNANNGVYGQGGNGAGTGGVSGNGVWGQGGSTASGDVGQGVVGKGGLYSSTEVSEIGGYGGYFQGGANYGSGLICLPYSGTAVNNAFAAVMQGSVKLNDSALASTVAVPNVLGRKNHIAAWGYFQAASSAAGTVLAGWNIASEAADGNSRRITFASAMTGGNGYGVWCESEIGSGFNVWPAPTGFRTATYVNVIAYNTTNGAAFTDANWNSRLYSVLVVGANA